jgi:hypothetical protein
MNWQNAIIPVLEYLKSNGASDVPDDKAAEIVESLLNLSDSTICDRCLENIVEQLEQGEWEDVVSSYDRAIKALKNP